MMALLSNKIDKTLSFPFINSESFLVLSLSIQKEKGLAGMQFLPLLFGIANLTALHVQKVPDVRLRIFD